MESIANLRLVEGDGEVVLPRWRIPSSNCRCCTDNLETAVVLPSSAKISQPRNPKHAEPVNHESFSAGTPGPGTWADEGLDLTIIISVNMKVTIKKWNTVATWRWDISEDDVCGICQVHFDGTCPTCKYPGDDCSLCECLDPSAQWVDYR